jgi:hypothetical protein
MAGSPEPNGLPPGVVAVGASAGGVEALTRFASGLPDDLRYAVLVVLHMPANASSVLAKIIDRSGPLPAMNAAAGTPLGPGQIHVAVPNHHLLVTDHQVMLSEGPTENGHRPAINALFRSGSLMTVSEHTYRCRVGHAWTADALLDARDDEIDGALWVALRSLQEKAKLSRKMAKNFGPGRLSDRYIEVADEAEHALTILGKRLSAATSGTDERGER